MMWRRRRQRPQQWFQMSEQDINALATYNSERHRGLRHTTAYSEKMRVLQERFDDEARKL